MFVWRSDMLKAYQRGHIIVLANDEQQAASEALRFFESWADNEIQQHHWYDEQRPERLAELRKDLSVKPETPNAMFIHGSD
jgi:hypothetical protein